MRNPKLIARLTIDLTVPADTWDGLTDDELAAICDAIEELDLHGAIKRLVETAMESRTLLQGCSANVSS